MNTHAYHTRILLSFYLLITSFFAHSQYCDSLVPVSIVDLSASPNQTWVSPYIARDGNCCGTSNPDKCLEFVITLNPNAIAVNFEITGGAVPPGALFYQIDCGPVTPVGSPICLSGAGPHHLTFCKPGNNSNEFSITSYSEPIIGPDITMNSGCNAFIFAQYYDEASINWTSISPGAPGSYDGLLSCTSGCDTTYVSAPNNPPAYIDYLVCGSDIGGCNPNPICDTIRVNFITPVTVTASPDGNHVCVGDSVLLTANAAGGTAPYNYLWSTGETTSSIQGFGGQYWVDVTDASGCLIASDTVTVIQDILVLNLNGVSPDCFGNATGAVSSAVLGGTPLYNYQWANGPTSSNQYNLNAGTYTLTVTDANGCQVTDSITLVDPPQLIGTLTTDTVICPGSNIDLITNINGGTGLYHYNWSPGGQTSSSITVSPVQQTLYGVEVSDDNGCTIQLNSIVDVIILDPNDLQASISTSVSCAGDSVWLSANYIGSDPSVVMAWNHCPACATNNPIVETPNVSTQYVLSATNACGQVIYDTVSVIVNPLPVIQIGLSSNSVCPDEAVTFFNIGNNDPTWSYSWNFGDGTGSNQMSPIHSYNNSASYPVSLTVTDNNGCTSQLFEGDTVVVNQQAIANFDASDFHGSMMEPNIDFYNQSINASGFWWDFGDGNTSGQVSPSHEYEEAGEYEVTLYASNQYGCNDSITQWIFLDPAFELYVPNAFTPDYDDFNESFFPKGFGIADEGYTFRIFNRWGDLIFETHDMDEGWTGHINNDLNKAQDGVYSWVVLFKDQRGGKHQREGHVSLLK